MQEVGKLFTILGKSSLFLNWEGACSLSLVWSTKIHGLLSHMSNLPNYNWVNNPLLDMNIQNLTRQGSHRLEKSLNIQDCREKYLKIKLALKST